jgi:hypothetical protein
VPFWPCRMLHFKMQRTCWSDGQQTFCSDVLCSGALSMYSSFLGSAACCCAVLCCAVAATEDDDGKWVPVVAFECRGIEPTAFHPEVGGAWGKCLHTCFLSKHVGSHWVPLRHIEFLWPEMQWHLYFGRA